LEKDFIIFFSNIKKEEIAVVPVKDAV